MIKFKRTTTLLFFSLVLILCVSCSNINTNINDDVNVDDTKDIQMIQNEVTQTTNITIKAAELSDSRITSMKLAGSNIPFLFDVEHDETINWASLWLDYYEFGEAVKRYGPIESMIHGHIGRTSLSMSANKTKDNVYSLYLAIQQNEGYGLSQTEIELNTSSMSFSMNNDIKGVLNEEIDLGYIILSSDSVGNDVGEMWQTRNNDFVYILRAMFNND